MKKIIKKSIICLSGLIIFISAFFALATPASAASYPSIYLDTEIWGINQNHYAGDWIVLKFTYFPKFTNEIVTVYIYDENGQLLSETEQDFYNTSYMKEYNLHWNTIGYEPGEYKVVTKIKFYTMYEWREEPSPDTYRIVLKDPKNKPKQGWSLENNKWAYYENGNKATNQWLKDSVGWCYVGADGYCVTNCWKQDSVGWCYLDKNGRMAINRWVKDSVGWCYLGADGYCVTNCWKRDSVGWCYLDANGRMKTNAWVQDSVGWCFVGADGYAVTNYWKRDSKGWCYLNSNGSMTKNKWVADGGKWYYCDADGYMLANTSRRIGNKIYYFNASGVCTNP